MQYTRSLLHFNDTNNPLKDEVIKNPLTYTKYGSPTISSTNAKFGSGLLVSGKQGIYTKLNLGGESFTIECWAKATSATSNGPFFTIYYAGQEFIVPEVYKWHYYGDYYDIKNLNFLNKLIHIAVCYDHTTQILYMFCNGSIIYSGKTTLFKTSRQNSVTLNFGPNIWTSVDYISGTFDEFRISTGIARYTSNFTPPTQQYIYGPYAEFPGTITGTYDRSPNGLTYKYRVRFEQGPYTTTSNVVNYETCQKLRLLMYLYKILIISIFLKTLKIRVVS